MEYSTEIPISKQEITMYEQLLGLSANLAAQAYPGYPEQARRLFGRPAHYIDDYGFINLPVGPWSIDYHPSQRSPELQPDYQTTRRLKQQGLQIDASGRPLHPWLEHMMADQAIGAVLGKGTYWYWGPNYTADNIVLCQDHVLLIKRRDNGMWALPGGHVDNNEPGAAAAIRELSEETGLKLPGDVTGSVVYKGPVADPRMTANAWPETTAISYVLDQSLPEVTGQDDAEEAAWIPIDIALQGNTLFGSHAFLLQRAIDTEAYNQK